MPGSASRAVAGNRPGSRPLRAHIEDTNPLTREPVLDSLDLHRVGHINHASRPTRAVDHAPLQDDAGALRCTRRNPHPAKPPPRIRRRLRRRIHSPPGSHGSTIEHIFERSTTGGRDVRTARRAGVVAHGKQTANNSNMLESRISPIGPRAITRFRRVTLPRSVRDAAGCLPGTTVEIGVINQRRRIIGVRSAHPELLTRRRGVIGHTRQVTEVGQVSIPQAVLARVGLDVLARVYFVQPRRTDIVWIVPEEGLGALMRTDLARLAGVNNFLEERR